MSKKPARLFLGSSIKDWYGVPRNRAKKDVGVRYEITQERRGIFDAWATQC